MISTWGCRNSEFISRERNKARRGRENQEPERKERVRGGGKRNPVREKERERLTAEEGSLKKVAREGGRERESGVKEQRLHVAVEGAIPSWRGTNFQSMWADRGQQTER
ncbi:hypothetical protein AMECASPLE_032356 [Ameca splendens]|uniref:Uncharacterized protein n=1 Tax=Ameca splendens TaxID=208324 RepID=A0ABV0ZGF2_9TELE